MSNDETTVMDCLEELKETAFKDLPAKAQDVALAGIMFFLLAI